MAASALPLTSDEKVLLIERHVTREFARDWDGAWETLSPGAYYDLLPFGIRLRGREAIEGAWRRLFALPAMTPAGEVATRSSETAFNDKVLQRHMSPVFDEEFMRLPGVERF